MVVFRSEALIMAIISKELIFSYKVATDLRAT